MPTPIHPQTIRWGDSIDVPDTRWHLRDGEQPRTLVANPRVLGLTATALGATYGVEPTPISVWARLREDSEP